MKTMRSMPTAATVLALVLIASACGGGADEPAPEGQAGTSVEGAADRDVWFSLDEEAGTVTDAEGTFPIAVRGTLTVDGQEYHFAGNRCPVPESGAVEDIEFFHAYGFAPDGRPFNFNGAGRHAFNITYDEDWRSTNTTFDEFSPEWTISGSEMRIEALEVRDTEAGESLPASVVVTCTS
jgi:hypothetical protein